MIKSFTVAITAFLFFSFGAAAQSIPQQLDKLAKDPKTTERAAKADVYIVGKKITDDSVATAPRKQDPVATKKKRKTCKKH